MSEHTKGRLVVKGEWLIPEAHADRVIGSSTNKAKDKSNYAHNVAIVRGKYQDDKANARRLTAAWNACEGMTTEEIEALTGVWPVINRLKEIVTEQDSMLGKRPCQNSRCNELNAARALLLEVSDFGLYIQPNGRMEFKGEELTSKIYTYLDACDKPGDTNV